MATDLAWFVKEKTGLSMEEFCERELGAEYKTFYVRLKKDRLYPAEVFYILHRLQLPIEKIFEGKSFEDLVIFSRESGVDRYVKKMLRDDEKREAVYLMAGLQKVKSKAPATDKIKIMKK